jgi:LmbE family N-acetylglucosaminyl deacetylase
MLPKEKTLANRLSIAMHEWPAESRKNMIEWVTDALKEQREHEREACAQIADTIDLVKVDFPLPGLTPAHKPTANTIAEQIRNRKTPTPEGVNTNEAT